jgi:hypothetical protein
MKQLLSRWWMRPWRAALGVMVAVLVACGGGGGVGEGGTGSFVSGSISGFGSVIVGGVRFDDSSAAFEDDDNPNSTPDRSALRLGMVVEVEGGPIDVSGATPTATARSIRIGSAIVGPVTEVLPLLRVARVLGQPVRVTAATVFGSGLEGGLAALAEGQVVEVHGFFGIDPDTNLPRFVATRIELRTTPPDTYKVRGIARAVEASAQTFRIGDETFDYSRVAGAQPMNDRFVRARVQTTPDSLGRWIVTRLDVGLRPLADTAQAKIEGIVTAFTSKVQFSVNGIAVTTDAQTQFDDEGTLAFGIRVEVEGRVSQGVLRATKVEIESDQEVDNQDFELHGNVSGVDPVARTFLLTAESGLRTFTVVYDDNTRFDDGSAATLPGYTGRVEVRGLWLAATGRLLARRIKFE